METNETEVVMADTAVNRINFLPWWDLDQSRALAMGDGTEESYSADFASP